MRKSLPIAVAVTLGTAGTTQAANLAVITSPPTILNIAILLLAGAAAAVCVRVLAAVKGGYLAKSWLLFMAGFGVLALGQLLSLLQALEMISLPIWVTPGLAVVWVSVFFYGVFDAKRILG